MSENQHYVPEFYLRLFIPPDLNGRKSGLIWVYRRGEQPDQRPVSKTASGPDTYGFTTPSGEFDNRSVENRLSREHEHPASKIIHNKILLEKPLDDSDRAVMSRFIVSLQRRTLQFKAEWEKPSVEMVRSFCENAEEFYRNKMRLIYNSEQKANEEFTRIWPDRQRERDEILANLPILPDNLFAQGTVEENMIEYYLPTMDWGFLKADVDCPFFTSDDPVAWSKGPGLKPPHGIALVPISRTYMIQISWQGGFNGQYKQLRFAESVALNRQTLRNAWKEVYAGQKSKILQEQVQKWSGTGFGIEVSLR